MRKIDSHEDYRNGVVTYELDDGRRVRFDARAVQRYGLAKVAKSCGIDVPTARYPVIQDGRMVGTLPAMFDPSNIRSKSFLYDGRPGDFRLDGERWIASRSIGPGDFLCIAGFVSA